MHAPQSQSCMWLEDKQEMFTFQEVDCFVLLLIPTFRLLVFMATISYFFYELYCWYYQQILTLLASKLQYELYFLHSVLATCELID